MLSLSQTDVNADADKDADASHHHEEIPTNLTEHTSEPLELGSESESESESELEILDEDMIIPGIKFINYRDESQIDSVMRLVGRDLSEPYSGEWNESCSQSVSQSVEGMHERMMILLSCIMIELWTTLNVQTDLYFGATLKPPPNIFPNTY